MIPEFREVKKSQMKARYVKPEFRAAWAARMRARYANPEFRAAWAAHMRARYKNPQFRAASRCKKKTAELAQFTDKAVKFFRRNIQEGPIYTCVSCHRHLYKQTVQMFEPDNYQSSSGGARQFFEPGHSQGSPTSYQCKGHSWRAR